MRDVTGKEMAGKMDHIILLRELHLFNLKRRKLVFACTGACQDKSHKLQQKKLQLEMRKSSTITVIKYWNRLSRVCESLYLQVFKAQLYETVLGHS